MSSEVDGGQRRTGRRQTGRSALLWVLLALIVLVPVGLGMMLYLSPAAPPEGQAVHAFAEVDGLALPALAERADDVSAIVVAGEESQTTLLRDGEGRWTVEQYDGYPATEAFVADLLDELSALRAIYAAPQLPATVAGQTVTNDHLSARNATRVAVLDESGDSIAEAAIGATLSTPAAEQLTSVVVKPGDADQVLIADSAIQPKSDPSVWVDGLVAHLPVDRVHSVEVTPTGSDRPLLVRWAPPSPGDFTAEGVSEDAEFAEGQWTYRWVASGLEDLRFDDVRKADSMPGLEEAIVSHAVYRTFDGLEITALLSRVDGNYWLRLDARVVEPVALEEDVILDQVIQPPEQVEAQAAAINALAETWVFQVSDLTVDKLLRNPVKLLELS